MLKYEKVVHVRLLRDFFNEESGILGNVPEELLALTLPRLEGRVVRIALSLHDVEPEAAALLLRDLLEGEVNRPKLVSQGRPLDGQALDRALGISSSRLTVISAAAPVAVDLVEPRLDVWIVPDEPESPLASFRMVSEAVFATVHFVFLPPPLKKRL